MGILRRFSNYYLSYGLKTVWLKVTKHRRIDLGDYDVWIKKHKMSEEEGNRQRSCLFPFMPKISIAVPTYETREKYLREMIDSVRNQTYSNWELCIADGSASNKVFNTVKDYVALDERIFIKKLKKNYGIVGNSNIALEMCSGEYIGLLDHDDLLAENALFEVVKTINRTDGLGVIYSDEDKISADSTTFFDPHFKSNFNIDLLRSNNYICHFCVIKRDIIHKIRGFRKEFEGAQDYDLILRSVEEAECVAHIPKILYHWRTHSGSTAEDPKSKLFAYSAGKKAIEEHLQRCGLRGNVRMTYYHGFYHVQYLLNPKEKVSVIIFGGQDKKRIAKCKKNIMKTAGYDNIHFCEVRQWSDLKHQKCLGNYILFIDSRLQMISSGWLRETLALCQREDVGAVGIKIYNRKDETIYHAGIVLGMSGYMLEGFPREACELAHRDEMQQDVSAISKHFMMISRKDFETAKQSLKDKMDEVEICDFLRRIKKLTVVDLQVEAYISVQNAVGNNRIENTDRKDIYYNSNLSLEAPGFTI